MTNRDAVIVELELDAGNSAVHYTVILYFFMTKHDIYEKR
jgi:hypothetical protein